MIPSTFMRDAGAARSRSSGGGCRADANESGDQDASGGRAKTASVLSHADHDCPVHSSPTLLYIWQLLGFGLT